MQVNLTDWRQLEFVSLQEAGRIVGRSRQWAADAVQFGYLDAVRLPSGGPMVVTVRSLERFVRHAQRKAPAPKRAKPAALELIVDNG
jgi:hypothetical protein